jgi:C1A family cysteine protease
MLYSTYKTGWIPDLPDKRDYTPQHPAIAPLLQKLRAEKTGRKLPPSVDLTQWFPPVTDQTVLDACTAHTAAALLGYFENKAFGKNLAPSRLFIYQAERFLLNQTGDRGAFLRTAMEVLRLFGAPPEEYWPYDASKLDVDPSAFCFDLASNYKAASYYRYDPPGHSRAALLVRVRTNLAAQLPSMFGTAIFSSFTQATNGEIPYPGQGEMPVGLHALVAVGYDDSKKITNQFYPGVETVGALRIRNSWGPQWGDGGYGWLPYEYLLQGLATDWWSLIKANYVDVGQFGDTAGAAPASGE